MLSAALIRAATQQTARRRVTRGDGMHAAHAAWIGPPFHRTPGYAAQTLGEQRPFWWPREMPMGQFCPDTA